MCSEHIQKLAILDSIELANKESCADVALVNMPFYTDKWPSIQLGQLKSVLVKEGYSVLDFYLNLAFCEYIGHDLYDAIAEEFITQLGEWLFSYSAFDKKDTSYDDQFFDYYKSHLFRYSCNSKEWKDELLKIKYELVPDFLKQVIKKIRWDQFKVVGFSCIFQQVVPSIALAKKLKEINPDLKIVFGGSAVEAEMGLEIKKHYPFINEVISGEGEVKLLEYLESCNAKSRRTNKFSNRYCDKNGFVNLNKLPVPDYDTYYKTYSLCEISNKLKEEHSLLLEMSRGCSWAEKTKGCLFCALNGKSLKVRKKKTIRVIEELAELTEKYNKYNFRIVDNMIVPEHLDLFFPFLSEGSYHYNLFCEIKPFLDIEKISLLKKAGCHSIQPGIETLSTKLLQLMNKGSKSTNNIFFLKWCTHYGVKALWNFMFSIPGETEEDYVKQSKLIPLLYHLYPPRSILPLRMDRFSRYFNDHHSLPVKNVRYAKCYDYIYPPHVDKTQVAVYYESETFVPTSSLVYDDFFNKIKLWIRLWEKFETRPQCYFHKGINCVHVIDKRIYTSPKLHKIEGLYADIFLKTVNYPVSYKEMELFRVDKNVNKKKWNSMLFELVQKGILIDQDGSYFNVVLPYCQNWNV